MGSVLKTSKVKLVSSCCELPLQNLHPLTLLSPSLPYSLTMPKSKREKVVSLTKTGKKTRDDKSNQIEAVRPPFLLYKPSSCCCEATKFADPLPLPFGTVCRSRSQPRNGPTSGCSTSATCETRTSRRSAPNGEGQSRFLPTTPALPWPAGQTDRITDYLRWVSLVNWGAR